MLLYSSSYIRQEKFFGRFIFLVIRFIFSIWLLILRPRLISILLGWDGLGVTSYLLVIYYQSEKSFSAGLLTALTNRLGDAGLLVLVGAGLKKGSWAFIFFRGQRAWLGPGLLFLLVGVAITKSAQVPFSSWLPAAIAAPTPVSSLVHSSTLVTAGVYLLVRLNYLLAEGGLLKFLVFVGLTTMLLAGRAAMLEVDMKKIVALSTLRQLGLIFFTAGLGLPLLGFFHLISHAYFKAMLFICAGGVIHRIKDFQDFRAMGGGALSLPATLGVFFVANLRLCGAPFMTGFYSKDLILELFLSGGAGILALLAALAATGLTVAYSLRAIRLIFFINTGSEAASSAQEADSWLLAGPLLLLAPSIAGGCALSWALCAHSTVVFLPGWLKGLVPLVLLGSGLLLSRPPKSGKRVEGDFVQFLWFQPFLFRRGLARQGAKLGKAAFFQGD